MRYAEIISEAEPQKPLTPAQATKRQDRINKQQAKVNDTKAQAQIKINAAQRKLTDIGA